MKITTFIKRTILLMVLALVAIVVVFLVIQYFLFQPSAGKITKTAQPEGLNNDSKTEVVPAENDAESAGEGIYLRDLPLTDAQKKSAAAFGIDVDTYYLTPATISCAEEKLGAERYQEIVAGGAPGVTEGIKLLQCL